ncbi:hypothetical protein NBRC111894_647 [Sporolactobacillus inulinus]|jgi:hypothetical protein|uniref:Uncharacterized protein n=1 Tax=Sporolactobacillus inulinus TaxID=2078 RepID=A0A4Y1Z7T3_9BACL|nr:hypothetical protein NBRC111894_647 [Sporolactobacillus inulinus]
MAVATKNQSGGALAPAASEQSELHKNQDGLSTKHSLVFLNQQFIAGLMIFD